MSGGDPPPCRGLSVKCLHRGFTIKGFSPTQLVSEALLPGAGRWELDLRLTLPAALTPPVASQTSSHIQSSTLPAPREPRAMGGGAG